ncbi:MAG TPA: aldo/keto reductase [Candidatus Saccharimonadales bacterium]|nr:aldo/keto reductase [Candidatus Saccharimonadales bacterium]
MQTKSGKAIHPIGIGTWAISSQATTQDTKYRGVVPVNGKEESEIEALRYSLSKGQNHIDCAEMYGGFYTDEVVGRALKGVNRKDLFIADKLWKTSVENGKVRPTVEKMFAKLGIDYLDLLYIHYPWEDVSWQEAMPQIDELIDEGLVRNFGVSNFTVADMLDVQKFAKHPIAANQMHFNVLYKAEVDKDFEKFCKQNAIQIVAYRPVERGDVLKDGTILEIAKAHNATPAQISLAWLIAKGMLPIPKSTQKSHIDENLGALNVKLSDAEIETLDKL